MIFRLFRGIVGSRKSIKDDGIINTQMVDYGKKLASIEKLGFFTIFLNTRYLCSSKKYYRLF